MKTAGQTRQFLLCSGKGKYFELLDLYLEFVMHSIIQRNDFYFRFLITGELIPF